MEVITEEILIYAGAFLFCLVVVFLYLLMQKKKSRIVEEKITKAKQDGLHEPVSLHPVIDLNKCLGSGACVAACPEKDIIGIVDGKARIINASRCIGHGACFHACPTQAISLFIGTEKRGVDLPQVNQSFETNVPGLYIAGELGGMGLIKNAVIQGQQAVQNIAKSISAPHDADYDLVVVGAGPAGISASLTAKKLNLKCIALEQDTLGGTVFTFPRSKIVMTSTMELPLYGKVKLFETSKSELLDLWKDVLLKNNIQIKENCKVEAIEEKNDHFIVTTLTGEQLSARYVLLAIGRRGTPRKLGIPGENLEKVAYRLLEPESIRGKEIVIVGGGDSAIESALLLNEDNHVTLSYRGDSFSRIKPKNSERISEAVASGTINLILATIPVAIEPESIVIESLKSGERQSIKNDLVYIFAGGELPTQFLNKIGISITTKFGEAILKH